MVERILFEIPALYRDSFRIRIWEFGEGEKTLCVVGAMRGNEYQQIYCCSLLVRRFAALEREGRISPGHKIAVIPCVNPYSVNIRKRFWASDNTDINRMYPGYEAGETTQRIAAALFNEVKDYKYGIQFASFYMSGRFVPHVRIMKTGMEDPELATQFGFPYVILHTPRPFDTATLNYNWQIWNTKAFSLYTTDTSQIDEASALFAVRAILRFLDRQGIISFRSYGGYVSQIVENKDLVSVRTSHAGFFLSRVSPGQEVVPGEKLARISDTCTGRLKEEVRSPVRGIVSFMRSDPLTYQYTAVFKIIRE